MDDTQINPDALPPTGGRWVRDPETGVLSPVDEQQPEPATGDEE